MKRVLLTIVCTAFGLVALLSFKTHRHPLPTAAGGLPSASAPSSGAGTTTSGGGGAARPQPHRTKAATTGPKKYVGAAIQTRYGIVQVQATVSGSHIDSVSFVQLTAFDGRSQEINSQAAPILLNETIAAQSAHIDTVSGASYTSDGYVQSLQSALDRAGIK